MSNLYFAYGSNLNLPEFNSWCEKKGHATDLLKPIGPVILPDYELAFTYRSRDRKGGVLDLRPRKGQIVPGMLFEADDDALTALDDKEGEPRIYHRISVTVIDRQGNRQTALTYQVTPANVEPYVKPSEQYLAIVREGYKHWDLNSTQLNEVAENGKPSCETGFFFYGTLMRGESRFSVLQEFGIDCILMAEVRGQLLDLGSFPGLLNPGTGDSLVQGEFVRLRDTEAALDKLDQIEGFQDHGHPDNLYDRTWISVGVGDGRVREGWTYVFNASTTSGRPIISGDWREHQGRRETFQKQLVQSHAGNDEFNLALRIAGREWFDNEAERVKHAQSLLPLHKAFASGKISERTLAKVSGNWAVIPSMAE